MGGNPQGLKMRLPGLGPVLFVHLAHFQTQGVELIGAEPPDIFLQLRLLPGPILLGPEIGPNYRAAIRGVVFVDDHPPAAKLREVQRRLFLYPGRHQDAHFDPGFLSHMRKL